MSVTALARVDVAEVLAWISAIDFAEWPQQHRVDAQLRPAMVNDLAWQGFGARTDTLVAELLAHLPAGARDCNRMLSVVMPGHSIEAHCDVQPSEWITRVHVPLTTNDRATIVIGGQSHHLEVGMAYLVDTRIEHAVRNDGNTPRIHFMFDVRR